MFLEKIIFISLLNLIGLFCLIRSLLLQGSGRPNAFRIAWKVVIGGQIDRLDSAAINSLWPAALSVSWRIMNLCYIVAWVITSESALTLAFILMIIFHGIWYFLSREEKEEYNRVIRFNQQFGVIFREIGTDSEMNGKSLAELDLRKKELLVLAVERVGRIMPFPKGLEVLEAGDRLVIFGDLNAFRTIFGSS